MKLKEPIERLFNPNLILENGKIKLRIVSLDDISELKKIAFEPKIWEYYVVEMTSENDLLEYVENKLEEFHGRKNVPFVIIDKKTNNIAGMSSFLNISIFDSRIEIGWSWLGKKFQGVGINGSYKKRMLSFAFDELGFIRVEFKTDVLNLKARRALEKIGAIEEGILRSHRQMPHNRRRDTIYYSILQNEWNLKTKLKGTEIYME